MSEVQRLLVVDDEPVVVTTLEQIFQSDGYTIVSAGSVQAALEVIREEVAVAVLDKNLPDGSGLEVLAALKQRWPFAEALILTGYPSLDSAIEALRYGAMDYLGKPFRHIDEVRHKVRQAAERSRFRKERERTLNELQEAQKLRAFAEHAQMMSQLGRMLAGIVHEIRSPLTVMQCTLELIHADRAVAAPGSDLRSSIEDALIACRQITAILTDVRRVSRMDAYGPSQRADIAVSEIVARAAALTRAETKEKLVLPVDVPAGLRVRGADTKLTQVLVNLLTNAAQATPPDGRIWVRASAHDGRVLLEVEDTGSGIPEEILDKLFEPFVTTKPPGVGTGLGLALCKHIVEEHAGRISLHSTPGKGTCVAIELPAAPSEGT